MLTDFWDSQGPVLEHYQAKCATINSACCNEMLTDRLKTKQNKLHGLSPRANYTDRATAACRRSNCQLLRIEGATWSA
jgi:hypothetical protein